MLVNFEYLLPTKIIFGENKYKEINKYIKELSQNNVLLVTDKFLLNQAYTNEIIKSNSIKYIYSKVTPNPTNLQVMDLVKYIESNNIDTLLVIGGGSSIDIAKAASVVANTNTNITDYLDSNANKLEIKKTIPIIALPTTSGTGSEVSKYAVISDSKTHLKDSITSDLICPKIAIVDPILTIGMPSAVTISTGLDALSHALESLVSTIENPFTNILAINAIELIFNNLNKARLNGNDLEVRSNMSFASTLAGIAMSHCCGTMGHAMGCQLTSQYNVPHGLACGVLQKYALDYAGDKKHNLKMLVDYLDKSNCNIEKAVSILQKKLDELFNQLGIEMNLKEYSMTDDGIKIMTKDSMNHGCMGLNPVKMDNKDINKVFQKLM